MKAERISVELSQDLPPCGGKCTVCSRDYFADKAWHDYVYTQLTERAPAMPFDARWGAFELIESQRKDHHVPRSKDFFDRGVSLCIEQHDAHAAPTWARHRVLVTLLVFVVCILLRSVVHHAD